MFNMRVSRAQRPHVLLPVPSPWMMSCHARLGVASLVTTGVNRSPVAYASLYANGNIAN